MIPEETSIFITFLLAMIGYAGLTATVLLSLNRKVPVLFWRTAALIILVHVIMVWAYRYNWQFSTSVRNGYSGFIIFHSALLMILVSTFIRERTAKILIRISFIVVTIGAVGAVFRYEVVEIYKVPVIICAFTGCAALLRKFRKQRKIISEFFNPVK
jgi:hypothetical protein